MKKSNQSGIFQKSNWIVPKFKYPAAGTAAPPHFVQGWAMEHGMGELLALLEIPFVSFVPPDDVCIGNKPLSMPQVKEILLTTLRPA